MTTLSIENIFASVEEKKILNDLSLTLKSGEIHAIMGPNGSGKSTLSKIILGHPAYTIDSGNIYLDKENINELETDERAKKGLFLAFQSPQKIPGLPLMQFLKTAYSNHQKYHDENAKPISVFQFKKTLEQEADKVHLQQHFLDRSVNEGLSGGEMKKTEMLQMRILEPKIAILDEIDSGLDIDALKIVCENLKDLYKKTKMGILMITHYNRILQYIKPDFVHIMMHGKIVKSGDAALADQVEKEGYSIFEEAKRSKLHVIK